MVDSSQILEAMKITERFLRDYLSAPHDTTNPIKASNALTMLVTARRAIELFGPSIKEVPAPLRDAALKEGDDL